MFNKVVFTLAVLGCGVLCSPVRAQSQTNVVKVFTEPAGLTFRVDGQTFRGAANFAWEANSKHDVFADDLDNKNFVGQRYAFEGWSTNLKPELLSKIQPITADPSVLWIRLSFTTQYRLIVNLIDCPEGAQVCASAGRVQIGGIFDRYTELWFPANSIVNARAFPNPGYIFTGWAQIPGGTRPTAFDISFAMVEPGQVAPMFQIANSAKVGVNLETFPPNLRVLADRTPYSPTMALEWGWGTVHTIGVDPVQMDNGTLYVFDSWSDGGDINHDIRVPNQTSSLSFTARFVRGVFGTFATVPAGLKIIVDGGPNFPEAGLAWKPGSTHRISAPETQTDAQGRKYRFVSWSNGKPAAFDHVVGQTDERFVATYQLLGQATLVTVPAGVTLDVDGASCTAPCSIEKDAGASIRVSVAAVRELSDDARLVFQGWGDSSETARVIALSAVPKTFTASYSRQNRLSVSATPPEGAVFTVTPSSPDSFYDEGSLVSIAVKLGLGFRAIGWTGDVSGSAMSAAVALDVPRIAVLKLDRVPGIAPSGIRSAAVGARADSVAPGSVISVFGANLAPEVRLGPSNLLPQTLSSVTVRVDGSFLPLVFVSPGQINAQLPAGASEGLHNLIVRWEGKPETAAPFLVSRNAPGLFNSGDPDRPIGAFLRPAGDAVTADNPAQAGEVVSVLGTGLGPYASMPPDGYLLGEDAGYTLVDGVTVLSGDQNTAPAIYAGRSATAVGVDAVRFQLPAALPDTPFLPIRIRVNGVESNTVLLPIRR